MRSCRDWRVEDAGAAPKKLSRESTRLCPWFGAEGEALWRTAGCNPGRGVCLSEFETERLAGAAVVEVGVYDGAFEDGIAIVPLPFALCQSLRFCWKLTF